LEIDKYTWKVKLSLRGGFRHEGPCGPVAETIPGGRALEPLKTPWKADFGD
jgi:hypothetical protein